MQLRKPKDLLADSCNKQTDYIEEQVSPRPHPLLHRPSKHEERKHIEDDMSQTTRIVQKSVSKKLKGVERIRCVVLEPQHLREVETKAKKNNLCQPNQQIDKDKIKRYRGDSLLEMLVNVHSVADKIKGESIPRDIIARCEIALLILEIFEELRLNTYSNRIALIGTNGDNTRRELPTVQIS